MKVEGRKSYAEREKGAELIALARKLRRYPGNGKRPSLREVSAELAPKGFVSASGKPFEARAVARMVEQRPRTFEAPREMKGGQRRFGASRVFVTGMGPQPVCDGSQHANHKTREFAKMRGFDRRLQTCALPPGPFFLAKPRRPFIHRGERLAMMTTPEEPRHVASPAAGLLHFNFRFAELRRTMRLFGSVSV